MSGAPGEGIEVRRLRKSYGSVRAVDDLSFSVQPGEVVGLLGPNGAGKSTTLESIAGLCIPDSGEVTVCGRVMSARATADTWRDIGVATQEIALYPGLSVLENLRFFGTLNGRTRSFVDGEIERLRTSLALAPLEPKRVADLSVGQQRLAHVASALVHRPRVILVDEPTAGLDIGTRADVLGVLAAAAHDGASVLFSSHYLGEVEQICSRVVIIHRGSLVAQGTVDALVREHGGGRVELGVGDETVLVEGQDLIGAINSLPSDRVVDWARVQSPSLDNVFASLTGLTLNASGEVAQ